MTRKRAEPAPDTTDRENEAEFDEWTFATGLPDGDALQRMCAEAAKLAVKELVDDMWLHAGFSRDRGKKQGPNRLEFSVHAWDGEVTVSRPLVEIIEELLDHYSYSDGILDKDDPEIMEIVRALEAVATLVRSRLGARPVMGEA